MGSRIYAPWNSSVEGLRIYFPGINKLCVRFYLANTDDLGCRVQ